MTFSEKQLIDGYLDETLSADELAALKRWLKESPANMRQFAESVLLHDRLRSELMVTAAIDRADPKTAVSTRQKSRFAGAVTGVIAAAVMVMVLLWKGLGETPASAAVVELNRLIAVTAQPADRTYLITVEESEIPPRREGVSDREEEHRPPKPPMDQALLHVRGGRQFVLVRKTVNGLPFITGSNGKTSWAVKSSGPVRVSSDLSRFSHDLPGHEHSMPLISIQDSLKQLLEAYEVRLLPPEVVAGDTTRVLTAVKKRGFRGPKRVEITYSVNSDLIRQIRLIEMPYGPERLTLRMTLLEERNLGETFFNHESHHAADRSVEQED